MSAILGISCFYHDSAASLVVDGDIVAAAQEERFTRIKHDSSFPVNAIIYCLEESGLEMKEIDKLFFYDNSYIKFERINENLGGTAFPICLYLEDIEPSNMKSSGKV